MLAENEDKMKKVFGVKNSITRSIAVYTILKILMKMKMENIEFAK